MYYRKLFSSSEVVSSEKCLNTGCLGKRGNPATDYSINVDETREQ